MTPSRRWIVAAIALAAAGCDGSPSAHAPDGAAPDGPAGATAPAPSYFDVQLALNGSGCTEGGCHNPTDREGGLDLVTDAIAALVDVPATGCSSAAARKLVVRGSPETSYLVDKLRGRNLCSGERMPYACDRADPSFCLSDDRVRLIEEWIRAGARGDDAQPASSSTSTSGASM